MLGGISEDRVSCNCGSMYTEQSATGSGEIWASNEDDGLTDEESSRGLF